MQGGSIRRGGGGATCSRVQEHCLLERSARTPACPTPAPHLDLLLLAEQALHQHLEQVSHLQRGCTDSARWGWWRGTRARVVWLHAGLPAVCSSHRWLRSPPRRTCSQTNT